MRVLTDREKKVSQAMMRAISSCFLLDRVNRAPPGRAIEMLPQYIQDDLKLLKSDDLNKVRPDLAVHGWV